MNLRIAVDLRGARKQEPCVLGFGQAKRVVSAERADLQSGDRMCQIIGGARWTREMQHVVNRPVDLYWLRYVVVDEVEVRIVKKRLQVLAAARQKIIDAEDLM